MLEQLFGSKTRVKLIRVFLDNPEKKFFVRELTRLTDTLINSIRRELDNLVDLKIVVIEESAEPKVEKRGLNTKKFYKLNKKNLFLQDLHNLFSKGKILVEKRLIEKIKKLGDVHYIAFSGVFIDDEKANTDVVVVGDMEMSKLKAVFSKFEKEINKQIRYTIMNLKEFELRSDIADNFLRDIIENERNIVVLDKLKKK